jgi:hypothetical protein
MFMIQKRAVPSVSLTEYVLVLSVPGSEVRTVWYGRSSRSQSVSLFKE